LQGIAAAVGRASMQAPRLALVRSALGLGNLGLDAPVEPAGFQPLGVARDRCVLQAEINADRALGCDLVAGGYLDGYT
jgi:hypothetical protein